MAEKRVLRDADKAPGTRPAAKKTPSKAGTAKQEPAKQKPVKQKSVKSSKASEKKPVKRNPARPSEPPEKKAKQTKPPVKQAKAGKPPAPQGKPPKKGKPPVNPAMDGKGMAKTPKAGKSHGKAAKPDGSKAGRPQERRKSVPAPRPQAPQKAARKPTERPVEAARPKEKRKPEKSIVVQSTQSFLPIQDVRNGVIITKDNRYLRIVEFTPINFMLRSAMEQASIIDSFAAMLKVAPAKVQFKSFARKADKERLLSKLRENLKEEENPLCRRLLREYMQLISSVADQNGVSRRFFMVVEYEAESGHNSTFEDIAHALDITVHSIKGFMRQCGNEMVKTNDFLGVDVQQLEILYDLLNRSRAESVPFSDHYPQIVSRYMDYTHRSYQDPPFIPVTEFFAPRSINLADSKYIVVDGKYYTFAYIPTKNFNNAEYAGWLSYLANAGEGIDVDIFLGKVPKERAQDSIVRQIRFKRLALNDSEDTNADFDELQGAISSGFYLKEGLSNNEDLYYMSVLITIVGDSVEEIEYKFRELNRISISHDKKLKMCRWQMEQAFLSALPLGRLDRGIQKKAKRNVLTSSAASTYLFSSFEICDDDGVLLGLNKSNRSLAVVDIFNTAKYNNANMAILGSSGAGKTFTMQCLATRMREKGIQVFILAPDKGHEFKRACNSIGGQYVLISSGSPHRINIMEIRPQDDEVQKLIDGDDLEMSRLADKASQVGLFVKLLADDMSKEEEQLLDEAIMRTYAKKGITTDNRSLYRNGKDGPYKEMPILEDLYDELKKDPLSRRIANILNRLVHGSASSFNGQTNVDLDNKYIVLDISRLSEGLKTVGMFVALDFVWDKAKEDRTKRKAVFMDELWTLIGSSSDPMAAKFVLSIFKTIRGYGGAAIAATQDLTDFFALDNGNYGKGIINNSQTKIILKLGQGEAKFVSETLGLTSTETMEITKFERGNGLVITNGNNVMIEFKAGKLETELITTDRLLLTEYAVNRRLEQQADGDEECEEVIQLC